MRDGAEFASYMVARWPAIVRTLVLLGAPPDDAEADAREGLTRCLPGWDRVRREDDVDVWVYRTVLEARGRASGGAPPDGEAVVDPTISDLEDRVELLRVLAAALDRLPPEEREAVVLRFVAELDTGQVADVLGVGYDVVEERVGAALATVDPTFREASEAIPLRRAPVGEVVALARSRRRRRWRWTAGGLAAVLAVVALGTWAGTRPDDELPAPVVTEEANPADLAWYANGVLHLARVTVELPQLREMVEVPDGVVYADRAGRVVLVDGLGELTGLGRTVPGVPIAALAERGWVTWLDGEGDPELVVHDTIARREIARLPVGAGARPVAVDQDKIYFDADGASFAWTAGERAPEPEPRDGLLDVSSAVRASTFSETSIMITQPLFDIEVTVPGVGAVVSPDGDHVMTRVDLDLPDELRVYEAATGEQVDVGISRDDVALAAAFGPDDTVSFVLARRDHSPGAGEFLRLSNSGPHTLRTCDLDLGTCRSVTQFTNDRGTAVLPH